MRVIRLQILHWISVCVVSGAMATQCVASGYQTLDASDLLRAAEGRLAAFFSCLRNEQVSIISAHRGGPTLGYPENAIETIAQLASKIPAVVEIDVATSKDGVLFLHHDNDLDRTTTGGGLVSETEWKDIKELYLRDNQGNTTPYHPSTFNELLAWSSGRVILQIDMKPPTSAHDVISAVKQAGAGGRVFYIAYTMEDAETLHALEPDAIIEVGFPNMDKLEDVTKAALVYSNLHALTNDAQPRPEFYLQLASYGITPVFGAFREIDEFAKSRDSIEPYRQLSTTGAILVVSDRPLAAQRGFFLDEQYTTKLSRCGVNASNH